jgi:hypothetical protein
MSSGSLIFGVLDNSIVASIVVVPALIRGISYQMILFYHSSIKLR